MCVHDVEAAFETFEEAANECKTSKQCKGVLDMDCNTQGRYFLCSERQESNKTIESCVYSKFIVGQDITLYYKQDKIYNISFVHNIISYRVLFN